MTKKRKRKKEKRLLPGDYLRKIRYDKLDDHPKDIETEINIGRFFDFPEDVKGVQFEDRDFLVFYFDDKKEYDIVLKYFEIPVKSAISHPKLNTTELVDMVKHAREGDGCETTERE